MGPGPSERSVAGRIWGRLSLGHVLMIVAGLLAVLVNFSLLRSRQETFQVAVAGQDLFPGTVVSEQYFDFVEVRLDRDVLDRLVSPTELGAFSGKVIARSLSEGDLVSEGDFRDASAPLSLRAMSIPIDPSHAAGGAIVINDRVDVITVTEDSAEYVVVNAQVLAVATSGSGIASSGGYSITIAVDDQTALRLAMAIAGRDLEIVRSTGAGEVTTLILPAEAGDAAVDSP